MAHANCILANDVVEHREVLGDSGFYYPYNDFESLAAKMLELSKDSKLVTEFGYKAQNRAKQCYSWESITDQYEKLLIEIAGG